MTDRAQYGFDFLAGMSIFLLTIGFIYGFAPGMFSPFTSDTGPNMIVADRSAASLSEQLLVESTTSPGTLNESCTEEFFSPAGPTAGCHFDADSGDLHAALGIDTTVGVNVTIEDNGTIVDERVRLAAGPKPDASTSVTVSQRIVFVYGEEKTLYVRVW